MSGINAGVVHAEAAVDSAAEPTGEATAEAAVEATAEAVRMGPEDAVFRRAMDPYRARGAIYLTAARVSRGDEGGLRAAGEFRIDSSSYIDDTGHFNAAEFVICYNQLMYVSLAASVQRGLLPQLSGWSLEDYWERQLPDVLIHSLASTFSRPIDPRGFRAEFAVTGVSERALGRGMLRLDTEIRFEDDAGGRARGAVGLVLVNVPGSGG